MRFTAFGLVPVVLLLAACANQEVAMTTENRAKLTETQVVVQVSQDEIFTNFERSQVASAMGGGLIPALFDAIIDNSRAKDAEAKSTAYRDALLGYDAPATLKQDLTESLAQIAWLKPSEIDIAHVQKEHYQNSVPPAKPPANSVLLFDISYFLQPDESAVKVTADVKLALGGSAILFHKKYDVSVPAPAGTGANHERWTRDNGVELRQALDKNLHGLAERVRADLESPQLKTAAVN